MQIEVRNAAEVMSNSIVARRTDGVISVFNLDNLLNSVFPKIVPLALTLLVYYLYAKKNWKPITIMGLILVLAVIVTIIGYIPGIGAFS